MRLILLNICNSCCLLSLLVDIVNILVKESSNYKWHRGKQDIIEGDIVIVIDRLSREPTKERKDDSRNSKEDTFVGEVEDHLADTNVVPSAMYKKQPPNHPELRNRIITCLNSIHALLSVNSNPDIGLFYH